MILYRKPGFQLWGWYSIYPHVAGGKTWDLEALQELFNSQLEYVGALGLEPLLLDSNLLQTGCWEVKGVVEGLVSSGHSTPNPACNFFTLFTYLCSFVYDKWWVTCRWVGQNSLVQQWLWLLKSDALSGRQLPKNPSLHSLSELDVLPLPWGHLCAAPACPAPARWPPNAQHRPWTRAFIPFIHSMVCQSRDTPSNE